MSDIDKIKNLFTEFGIGFTEEAFDDGFIIRCFKGDKKIDGYGGFYTDFNFDENGKFESIGAYE